MRFRSTKPNSALGDNPVTEGSEGGECGECGGMWGVLRPTNVTNGLWTVINANKRPYWYCFGIC